MKKRHTSNASFRQTLLIVFVGGVASVFCLLLLCFPHAAKEGVLSGLRQCYGTLIPSLLPFMVLSGLLLHLLPIKTQHKFFSVLSNVIFHLPACCLPVVLFSLVGGFPVGGLLGVSLLHRGSISKDEAQRLLLFCVCPGPAFVMSAVGDGMLQSSGAGW